MLNKVMLIGNLGDDPEIIEMDSGDLLAKLSIATSERWKDRETGEQQERTTWHRVAVWGAACGPIEEYLHKGARVYVEGQLQTRSYETDDGDTRYITEVVVRPYRGEVRFLNYRGPDDDGDYDDDEDDRRSRRRGRNERRGNGRSRSRSKGNRRSGNRSRRNSGGRRERSSSRRRSRPTQKKMAGMEEEFDINEVPF